MKTTFKILIAGIALITSTQLISCKKDKKEEPKTLVGTWNSSTFYSKETTNGVVTSEGTFNFPGLLAITFNSDMTYKRYSPLDPTETESGKYQTMGSKLILNYTDATGSQSDTADYTFSDNTLEMKEVYTEVMDSETIVTEDKITFTRQ